MAKSQKKKTGSKKRAKAIKKATRRARRSRARDHGIGGRFRPGMILKREMLETVAGGVVGSVAIPAAVEKWVAPHLPASLATANLRPLVDLAAGFAAAMVVSRFSRRGATGIALGSAIRAGATYATPHIRKAIGLSGYVTNPAGIPLYGFEPAGFLGGQGVGAMDPNLELAFVNN